jgi:hypothetical protein
MRKSGRNCYQRFNKRLPIINGENLATLIMVKIAKGIIDPKASLHMIGYKLRDKLRENLSFHTKPRRNIKEPGLVGLNFFYFLYSYVHTIIGSLLPPSPYPLPFAPTPSLPSRYCFTLISNFVEERV